MISLTLGSMKTTEEITHLERRQIQAPVVVGIIKELAKSVGEDEALMVVGRAIEQESIDGGAVVATTKGNQMNVLSDHVREVWCDGGALEIDMIEDSKDALSFNVTKCQYAAYYKSIGLDRRYGACLSCNRDKAFIEGFNPSIKLTRTDTIMNGASHCDFSFKKDEL